MLVQAGSSFLTVRTSTPISSPKFFDAWFLLLIEMHSFVIQGEMKDPAVGAEVYAWGSGFGCVLRAGYSQVQVIRYQEFYLCEIVEGELDLRLGGY